MKKLFWGSLIVLLFSSCISTKGDVQLYAEYYNLGNAFFQQEDYAKSINYYLKALEGDSSLYKARFNLVNAYIFESNFTEALNQIELLESLDSENLKIKELYAYLSYMNNDLNKSLELYQELYQIGDTSESILKNLSVLNYLSNNYIEASRYIKELISFVDNKDYYFMAGIIYEASSDLNQAIDFYELSLEKGNYDISMLKSMESMYRNNNDFNNLKLILNTIIDHSGDDISLKSNTLFDLAKIYLLEDQNFSEGYSILERALNEGFSNEQAALDLLNDPDLMENDKIRSLFLENNLIS